MSNYVNRIYMIISSSNVENINFQTIAETSPATLRYSIDGQYTFVKWVGSTPAWLQQCNNTHGPYTYEEMTQILSGTNWTNSLPG